MRSRLFLLLTALAVFMGSATALAAPSADTLLTAGYDAEEMALLFNVSALFDEDSPFEANNTNSYDCRLVGDFIYQLDAAAAADATSVEVTGLESQTAGSPTDVGSAVPTDFSDVFFHQEDTDATGTDVLAPLAYGAAGTEECTLTALLLGEDVNHGKVVSGFVHALKDMGLKGAGCLIHNVSQTEWGKEDLTGGPVVSTDLTVTLAGFESSCNHGKAKQDTADTESTGKGKPAWAGKDGDRSLKPGKGGND